MERIYVVSHIKSGNCGTSGKHFLGILSHGIGGNRERSLIFRKIVNDCQIKRFRLPKRQSTNSN